mgnify:CR=1 FL=1
MMSIFKKSLPREEKGPDLSRRSFLGGALVLAAAASLPLSKLPDGTYTLWGDGIHDDADALNALFDRKPVILAETGELITSPQDQISLKNSYHLVSKTIYLRKDGIIIDGCTFKTSPDFQSDVILQCASRHCIINSCRIIRTVGMVSTSVRSPLNLNTPFTSGLYHV